MPKKETLAYFAHLRSLGFVPQYESAEERRTVEGKMALVRIRERQAGTWRRPSYGTTRADDPARGSARR